MWYDKSTDTILKHILFHFLLTTDLQIKKSPLFHLRVGLGWGKETLEIILLIHDRVRIQPWADSNALVLPAKYLGRGRVRCQDKNRDSEIYNTCRSLVWVPQYVFTTSGAFQTMVSSMKTVLQALPIIKSKWGWKRCFPTTLALWMHSAVRPSFHHPPDHLLKFRHVL